MLAVVGITLVASWLVGINAELYRALGRPDVNTKLIFFAILYYLPAYFLAARFGLETFLYVRFGLAVAAIPIHVFVYKRMMNGSALYPLVRRRPFYLAAIAMGAAIGIARWGLAAAPALPSVVALAALAMVGITSLHVTMVWLLDRAFVQQVSRLIARAATT